VSGVAWFDGELWKKCSQTGFGQPIESAQLLDPTSSALLGGLMLPDTLPILDNGCGDALCLRFNLKGTVSEVVRWEHEGGNWTPFGTSLCEALLLDAALTLMEEPLDDGELRLEDIGSDTLAGHSSGWKAKVHRRGSGRSSARSTHFPSWRSWRPVLRKRLCAAYFAKTVARVGCKGLAAGPAATRWPRNSACHGLYSPSGFSIRD
jgi:hypothetical protein